MSDPNESFNRGLYGQGLGPNDDIDKYQAGDAVRRMNNERLAGSSQPPMQIGGSENVLYSGPVSAAGANFGVFIAAVFTVFIFSGFIFPTLYPIPSVIALIAGFATNGLLRVAAPTLGPDDRLPFAMLATVVAFWPMMRLDHRLAASVAPYRIVRHGLRVLLIGNCLAILLLSENEAIPRSAYAAMQIFSDSRYLPTMAVCAIATHFFLVKATWIRGKWDAGLELFRLRPSGLDDAA